MQEGKKEPTPTAVAPAGGKQPNFCDRLQKAFHARPAFQPLRRLTARHGHQDGGAASAAAPAQPARKHGGPPVPAAPPRPLTSSSPSPVGGGAPAPTAPQAPRRPSPVRLPAVTTATSNAARKKAAASSLPTGPPVPAPPPDVMARAPAADEKVDDKAPQATAKNRVMGFSVRKAFSPSSK